MNARQEETPVVQPCIDQPLESIVAGDGRTLAFVRYGSRTGRPLYFFHGFPGSRLQAALVHEQALRADVCLVAIDRPGFGCSTLQPRRRILDWPGDVAAVADHLGHERFGVLGVSCGGPYALACARALPERIGYVGLLAAVGPMNLPRLNRAQMPLLRVMFALARIHPALVSPILALDRWLFRRNPNAAVDALARLMTPPDRHLLAVDPVAGARFAASLAEAYRQGIGGALREVRLIAVQGEFELRDIKLPVQVYQGDIDRNVPPQMGRYIANQLPHGKLHVYRDEGHLSIVVNRFDQCLRDFLAAQADLSSSGDLR